MFLDNKYTKLYYKIIDKCQSDIGENHHIIPKSLGGGDDFENLVKVSYKAHFILHRLLPKMVKLESHKIAMNYALFMMMNRKISHFSSTTYEVIRTEVSQTMRLNNPMFEPSVIAKRTGQKRSNETKLRIAEGNLRRWSNTARPILNFDCPICKNPIKTRIPTQKTCSKKCSAVLQHRK